MANNTKKEKKNFLKGMKSELKKVIWPTTKQLTNSTIAVITLVLVVTVLVSILNFVFRTLHDGGVSWLKGKIYKDSEVTNTEIINSDENEVTSDSVTNETEEQNSVENSEEVIVE